jgi:hypothetical protein
MLAGVVAIARSGQGIGGRTVAPRRRRSRLGPVRTNWFIAAVVLGIVAIVIAAIAMRLS